MLTELFPRTHRRYSSLPLLGPVLGDFAAWIVAHGHSPVAVRRHLRAARLLDQRFGRRGLRSLKDVQRDDLRVCAPGHAQDDPALAAGARQLEQYLEARGLLARQRVVPLPRAVADYQTYLTVLRGLATATIGQHVATASQFLTHLAATTPPTPLNRLTPAAVDGFVEMMSVCRARAALQHTVAQLRSFLRWLGAQRRVPSGLDTQIDTPRVYRQEQLPRALPWDTVWALLRGIDRTTALGRRNYAILLLIATYGLRASEVVALTLDAVEWRRREVRIVRRKVEGVLLLPLTDAVGAALLDYLRHGRPSAPTRVVFLRHRPPAASLNQRPSRTSFEPRYVAVAWQSRFTARTVCATRSPCTCCGKASRSKRLETCSGIAAWKALAYTLRLAVEDLGYQADRCDFARYRRERVSRTRLRLSTYSPYRTMLSHSIGLTWRSRESSTPWPSGSALRMTRDMSLACQ